MSVDPRSAAFYFANPDKYVRRNPYIKLRSRVVQEMLAGFRGGSILDVGAGSGELTIPLLEAGSHILFVDSSQGMIELALGNVPLTHRDKARAVCAGVMEFSTDERFDAVVCIGVLAHVPAWHEALARLGSWVAPDGVLLLQLTDHEALLGRLSHHIGRLSSAVLQRARHAHQRMTLRDIERTLARVGFTLKESRRYCFIPGLRLLPGSLAAAIARSASAGPFADRYGGEVIAMFQRR
jgi:2-polyprenyl-3-methyl-5-hydroxy-6-metoxy-1,4-benzoquinol methylase